MSLAPCDRYYKEILGGKSVNFLPNPTFAHGDVSFNIRNILDRLRKERKCRVFVRVDVHFSETDRVVPDIVVVCDENKLFGGRIVRGAPDLIVEVLSPITRRRDRYLKKNLYEKYGVPEYWIVHPEEFTVEVYILRGGRYVMDDFYEIPVYWAFEHMTDEEKATVQYTFSPSMFEDLVVDVREIFEDIDIGGQNEK